MLKIIYTLAALTCLSYAATAGAQVKGGEDRLPSAVVSYEDLDLGTTAGKRVLQNRLDAAVTRLCKQQGFISLHQQIAERHCITAARTSGAAGLQQALAQHQLRAAAPTKIELSAR